MNDLNSQELTVLDRCAKALAATERLEQVADLRNSAEAIRVWAKSAHQSLEIRNRAAALRLAAERKAGKMLSQMNLKGGDRKSNDHDDRLKLKEVGITQNQSTRWQKVAEISDELFANYVQNCALIGKEITATGLLSLAADSKQRPEHSDQELGPKPAVETGLHDDTTKTPIHMHGDAWSDLQDVANHLNLLRKVLTPWIRGKYNGLSTTERRVVKYLLDEVDKLIKKIGGR